MPHLARIVAIFSIGLGFIFTLVSAMHFFSAYNNLFEMKMSQALLFFSNLATGILLLLGGRELFTQKNWARLMLGCAWVLLTVCFVLNLLRDINFDLTGFLSALLRDSSAGLALIIIVPVLLFVSIFFLSIIVYLFRNEELKKFTNR